MTTEFYVRKRIPGIGMVSSLAHKLEGTPDNPESATIGKYTFTDRGDRLTVKRGKSKKTISVGKIGDEIPVSHKFLKRMNPYSRSSDLGEVTEILHRRSV